MSSGKQRPKLGLNATARHFHRQVFGHPPGSQACHSRDTRAVHSTKIKSAEKNHRARNTRVSRINELAQEEKEPEKRRKKERRGKREREEEREGRRGKRKKEDKGRGEREREGERDAGSKSNSSLSR